MFQESKALDRIYRVFLHILPAYVIDVIARILGHKPFLVRLVGKMHYGLGLLEYFTTRDRACKVQCKKGSSYNSENTWKAGVNTDLLL